MKKNGKYYTLPRVFGRIREDRIYDVPLDEIAEKWHQRRVYDEVKVAKLANSIRENGLCEPILLLVNRNKRDPAGCNTLKRIAVRIAALVKAIGNKNTYEFSLISGGYRLRAYSLLGLSTIPARFLCEEITFLPDSVVVGKNSEKRAIDRYKLRKDIRLTRNNRLAAALCAHEFTENVQYFDEAARLSELCRIFGCRINHLAAVLTLDKAETERKVSLLMLSDKLRTILEQNMLPEAFASLLLRLPNDQMRVSALERIVDDSMSYPDAERLVEQMKTEKSSSYTQTRQFYCKDPRILVNSVVKAAKSIQNSGLDVEYDVLETESGATVTVNVQKPVCKSLSIVSRETLSVK